MPDPLHVLHVCLHTDPYDDPGAGDVGGMNVVVRHSAEAMAALGHRVELVTRLSRPGAAPTETPAPGVRVHRLPVGPQRPLPKGAHEDLMAPFGAALRDLPTPHLVHSHHWFSGVAALPVAREWQVPHVQTFHSIAADPRTPLAHGERPESPGRLDGEARLARASQLVVTVSRAEARTVADRLGGNRIAQVHPGVDTEMFQPAAAPGSGAVVAARLEPLKGIDLAIEALSRVPKPVRPALTVAGGATDPTSHYPEELRAQARRLGVTATFTGPQSRNQLAESFRTAGLLLVPSHSETYGLVALEAAASGIPVLASDSGGLREAVVDGHTGILLGTRDPADWAREITRLAADPTLAARMGRAGRAHALTHTWHRSATLLVAAYGTALGAT
ncbi:MAG TPA: glycosyltransferase [Actinomycetaceae bacterium]|nr:glycosyltransferase [Actinomycetaceae bacterium]